MPSKPLKRVKPMDAGDGPSIMLQSPMQSHFAPFIIGNSKTTSAQSVVQHDSALGQHLVICGAGPSLRDEAPNYIPTADAVWGCNSALTWLLTNGYAPTHGFAVDQTPEMVQEWASTPDVEYLIASTVHPHLVQLLELRERRVRFFHNYVGIKERPVAYTVCRDCEAISDFGVKRCPTCGSRALNAQRMEYEDWLYSALYPGTVRAGSGLNAVTRAIDVALYMGYETITVLGADCALRVKNPMPDVALGSPEHQRWLTEDVEMHADGGHALASRATMMTLDGEIDGRVWTSKPDMLISAVFLVKMARVIGPRLRLVGDTLPVALAGKDDAYLSRLPALVDGNGKEIQYA